VTDSELSRICCDGGGRYPRSVCRRWRALQGRLRTAEVAERSAMQFFPSSVLSWVEESELEGGVMFADEELSDDAYSARLGH
jgi:hypothetical protein